jgi:hypothetical protein
MFSALEDAQPLFFPEVPDENILGCAHCRLLALMTHKRGWKLFSLFTSI